MTIGAVEETATAEAAELSDINVFGMLRTTRAVLPYMRSQRRGRIVNVSSVLGVLPAPYMGLYSATQHAMEGLSESLDHEVRQFGIRATLVQYSSMAGGTRRHRGIKLCDYGKLIVAIDTLERQAPRARAG